MEVGGNGVGVEGCDSNLMIYQILWGNTREIFHLKSGLLPSQAQENMLLSDGIFLCIA